MVATKNNWFRKKTLLSLVLSMLLMAVTLPFSFVNNTCDVFYCNSFLLYSVEFSQQEKQDVVSKLDDQLFYDRLNSFLDEANSANELDANFIYQKNNLSYSVNKHDYQSMILFSFYSEKKTESILMSSCFEIIIKKHYSELDLTSQSPKILDNYGLTYVKNNNNYSLIYYVSLPVFFVVLCLTIAAFIFDYKDRKMVVFENYNCIDI